MVRWYGVQTETSVKRDNFRLSAAVAVGAVFLYHVTEWHTRVGSQKKEDPSSGGFRINDVGGKTGICVLHELTKLEWVSDVAAKYSVFGVVNVADEAK